MEIKEIFKYSVQKSASDIHIREDEFLYLRINNQLKKIEDYYISKENIENILIDLNIDLEYININKFIDTSKSIKNLGNFRINCYLEKGNISIAIRVLPFKIPNFKDLNLPPIISDFAKLKNGLFLVTGPTGSGKSSVIASMVDYINRNYNKHIITIEEPIEYIHNNINSFITQKEIGKDELNFKNALKSSLRQDPDIIVLGEMRDLETIEIAIEAAETGHLVFSTLHTLGANKTIDRIVSSFNTINANQIRNQLSNVLEGVVSLLLLPCKDGNSRVLATEIMIVNDSIRNLIRNNEIHQINNEIQTNRSKGMHLMDYSLLSLYNKNMISDEVLNTFLQDKNLINNYLNTNYY